MVFSVPRLWGAESSFGIPRRFLWDHHRWLIGWGRLLKDQLDRRLVAKLSSRAAFDKRSDARVVTHWRWATVDSLSTILPAIEATYHATFWTLTYYLLMIKEVLRFATCGSKSDTLFFEAHFALTLDLAKGRIRITCFHFYNGCKSAETRLTLVLFRMVAPFFVRAWFQRLHGALSDIPIVQSSFWLSLCCHTLTDLSLLSRTLAATTKVSRAYRQDSWACRAFTKANLSCKVDIIEMTYDSVAIKQGWLVTLRA